MMRIPALGIRVVATIDKYAWTTESRGGKGSMRPLSQGESMLTPALTGFFTAFLGILQ